MEEIRTNVFEEVVRVSKERDHEKEQKNFWKGKYYELLKEHKETLKIVRKLKNENTPSSQLPVYDKPVMKSPSRPPVGANPRGKPKGGNGATRKIPKKIDKRIKVKFTKDQMKLLRERFGSRLKIKKVKLFPFWRLIPARFEVVQPTVQRAYVGKKLVAQATHPDVPSEGIFDNATLSWFISLKNGFAGSYERISEYIEEMTEEKFSAQAIKDAVKRTGEKLKPEYKKLESELRESDYVGIDPTGWRVNGVNFALMLFCTINTVFIHIDKSKARYVITKILGNFFEGVVGSDCAPEFQKFAKWFQKCWSHLLRTTYTLAMLKPKEDIAKLHELLTNLFNEMKEFLAKEPLSDEREIKYKYFDEKIEKIIKYKWKSEDAKSIVKNRLVRFRNDWCTAILFTGIPLTNNQTETWIKSAMPTRKISYGHRTEKGAEIYAVTQSLRLTWRLRGLSPFHAMVDKLKNINNEFEIKAI